MKPEIRVLIVSRDEMLLRTRELMMGAYFHATGVGRPSEAKAQLQADTDALKDEIDAVHA